MRDVLLKSGVAGRALALVLSAAELHARGLGLGVLPAVVGADTAVVGSRRRSGVPSGHRSGVGSGRFGGVGGGGGRRSLLTLAIQARLVT